MQKLVSIVLVLLTALGFMLSWTSPLLADDAASKLAFTAQPSNTTAGANISPAITVAVEDASGNVITTDNATQVTLAITSGTGTTCAVLSRSEDSYRDSRRGHFQYPQY